MINGSEKSQHPLRHSTLTVAICSALLMTQARAATDDGSPEMTVTASDSAESGYTPARAALPAKYQPRDWMKRNRSAP